jgi:hypothetical protein
MHSDRRAKVATAATVVGLAAQGGAALGSNHGISGPVASAGNGSAPIVTGASGSSSTTANAVASAGVEGQRAPIVTRASATAGVAATTDD